VRGLAPAQLAQLSAAGDRLDSCLSAAREKLAMRIRCIGKVVD
jgi:hypothetical protein